MKNRTIEKKLCRATGLSISPEQAPFIEQRLKDYGFIFQGITDYVRVLIEYDKKHKVLEQMGLRPFRGGYASAERALAA